MKLKHKKKNSPIRVVIVCICTNAAHRKEEGCITLHLGVAVIAWRKSQEIVFCRSLLRYMFNLRDSISSITHYFHSPALENQPSFSHFASQLPLFFFQLSTMFQTLISITSLVALPAVIPSWPATSNETCIFFSFWFNYNGFIVPITHLKRINLNERILFNWLIWSNT